ncbi:MAG: HAD family phosphatase [Alistipes sp.]
MKNIVFDLGGVVFARDKNKCTQEFIDFFAFVRAPQMPKFWEEYDRGALSINEVKEVLCRINGCTREKCDLFVDLAIAKQEAIEPTQQLIEQLKGAGYQLYVLSNMSKEFIEFLRQQPVYRHFEGEVVSCEEHTVKPEPHIFELLLGRYNLDPAETLFIDDRADNLTAATKFGIHIQLFNHHDPATTCATLRQQLLS